MPAAAAPAPIPVPAPAPAAPAKPAANSNSRLGKVVTGRRKIPFRAFFYGPAGVGKTTLAAHAPSPIWVDVNDGSSLLDVPRYSFRDEPNGHVPLTYRELLGSIDDLTANASPYKSLVIDTVDDLEGLLWKFITERDSTPRKPLNSLEDYGFNKGPDIALDEWRALAVKLDRLRASRQMNIILLGHAQVRNFKNPEGEDYDRYIPRINVKAGGFLSQWCEVTGFCCFEEGSGKLSKDERERAKGFSTGKRLVKLARTAAFDAKSRYALPEQVMLEEANPWAPFAKALEDSMGLDIPALEKLIAAETDRIGDGETTTKVQAAVADAIKKGDSDALHRFLNGLKQRPAKQAE